MGKENSSCNLWSFSRILVKNHPKLNLVTHDQIIEPHCLPTFNSHAIEINIHKIEGLAEHFVYFNDDTFINSPLEPEFFFKNGLPCDGIQLQPLMVVGEENFRRSCFDGCRNY